MAMDVAVVGEEESRLEGFEDDEEVVVVGGRQFRKEVHILHGLPSGPRTIPGGRGDAAVLLDILVVGSIRFWAAICRNPPQRRPLGVLTLVVISLATFLVLLE
jgi:hypothetical protein